MRSLVLIGRRSASVVEKTKDADERHGSMEREIGEEKEVSCYHDLAERETAVADGYCPICLAAELDRLKKLIQEHDEFCPECWPIKDT